MKETLWKPGRIAAVTLVALIALGAWVASGAMMVVNVIQVQGSELVAEEEVVRLSGITYGQAMLSIDASEVKRSIESNRFLVLKELDRQYPSRVVINVETRRPVAVMQYINDYMLIDREGVILARYAQLEFSEDLPFVTGFELSDASARLDAGLLSEGGSNATAALRILDEIYCQELSDYISELNVSELDNLYLVTLNGIQVMIGNLDYLTEKIALTKAVLPYLNDETQSGGFLDVTAVNKADYMKARISQTTSMDYSDAQSVMR